MVQIVYTNSKCSDLWEIFQKQNLKYCNLPINFISNKEPKNLGYSKLHLYNDDEPYYKVWIDSLKNFDSEYFIYLQEDFLLYDKVDENKLSEYLNFLKSNKKYSFVRLLKSGNLEQNKVTETLYEIESDNYDIFSMQSTIWRTEDYIKLLNEVKDSEWLENYKYRNAAIKLKIKGLYHYDNEPKRGISHFDSKVYPYVATALVRGKWNLNEYRNELGFILNENNIKIELRGIF